MDTQRDRVAKKQMQPFIPPGKRKIPTAWGAFKGEHILAIKIETSDTNSRLRTLFDVESVVETEEGDDNSYRSEGARRTI